MSKSKLLNFATTFLTLGLFFERDNNVIVFYVTFIVFVGISIFSYRFMKYSSTSFILKRYALFTLFAGVSVFWSIDNILAFKMFIRLCTVLFIVYLLFGNSTGSSSLNAFNLGLHLGVLLNLILLISPWRGLLMNEENRFCGTFHNPNSLSISIIIYLYFQSKRFIEKKNIILGYYLFVIFISLAIIYFTGSRKGLIFGAAILFPSFYTLYKSKKQFRVYLISFFLLFIPILGSFFVVNWDELSSTEGTISRLSGFFEFLNGGEGDSSTRWRFIFIEMAFDVFKNNVLYGVGIDNFQTFAGEGHYAHNNYIEILADLGIIGFLLLYSIYFKLFKFLKRNKAKVIDYGFLVIILLMELALVSYFSRIFWISIIMFYFLNKNQINKDKFKICIYESN